ncbi:MAG: GDP-mannose 4,6-dehydratase [Candidatus Kerfeldbacteria bacterium]|nr:GDP-mannose 4,6-dehydratase [Candidatus Kerfeldbacteria bacterium]
MSSKKSPTHSNQYRNKRVLVTGGLGFIGSNLAIRLVELGAKVTILDSMIDDYGGNFFNIAPVKNKVTVNISDMRDKYGINYLVRDQDIIFNLAGQLSHIDSMTDPYADLEINCTAQLSLLEAVRHHNPKAVVVLTSTRQIYGKPQYLPVDEQHPISPVDVNGINTAAGEWYHTLYHNVYGLKTVSLRLTNTFGPRQLMKHNRQGFIPFFIRLLIEGKTINLFGDGKQVRDINDVDDVVSALLLSGTKPAAIGQVYNLGGEPISLLDLTKLMIKVNGKGKYTLTPFPPEKKRIDIGDYYGDYTKIKTELGWKPRITLVDAVRRTFAYYRKNRKYYW